MFNHEQRNNEPFFPENKLQGRRALDLLKQAIIDGKIDANRLAMGYESLVGSEPYDASKDGYVKPGNQEYENVCFGFLTRLQGRLLKTEDGEVQELTNKINEIYESALIS